MLTSPRRIDQNGTERAYIRFAALGDSATFGLGDQTGDGCRGWASLLVSSMRVEHDVSYCNLAVPGARAADVLRDQLAAALDHRPHVASLIVGLNDTLRADWDAARLHRDLLTCAEQLTSSGALLMTARFHDHTRVFRLPAVLARPMRGRIDALNAAYDEIQDRFGGILVDLSAHPGIYEREFWSADRLHPSELGHRVLADEFAAHLSAEGLSFDPPGLTLDGPKPTRGDTWGLVINEVVPWMGRRMREFAPVAMQNVRADLTSRLLGYRGPAHA